MEERVRDLSACHTKQEWKGGKKQSFCRGQGVLNHEGNKIYENEK